ncbi:putative DNA-directed RNA polymerase III subunit RPC6 [Apostichopus japonicus]|uniref:DNA-directed RNA polymerase III subunit RPC6 n=1 Tax=Stichopus japonicus TaxID=307972 RepID=A0A2G8K5T7_STIJA|nr:putative DNA-directed RNA polymerase III subunit RPC6 [Apostichopus japonicus]
MAGASISIKQETPDGGGDGGLAGDSLEKRILKVCNQDPKGVPDTILQLNLPGVGVKEKVKAINGLLSKGKIDLVNGTNGQLLYKLKDTQTQSDLKGSDDQERLVYQIIKEAGNKGIWIRDIRRGCGLAPPPLNKILKRMENKKAIKAIKSVGDSKKKVYMLFDLEPDRSVTGGAWYSDQDFDAEFVNVLNQTCFKFLQEKMEAAAKLDIDPLLKLNRSYASPVEVWKYIQELGLLSNEVNLGVDDIETILNTLIYDGKVEMTVSVSQSSSDKSVRTKMFRAIQPLSEPAGLMRVPCGVCPIFDNCYEGGAVSPSTCIYMKEWMDY